MMLVYAITVFFISASLGAETDKRNDDMSLASLQDLVQQQASTIQAQAAALTALTTRLTNAEHTITQQAATMNSQLTTLNSHTSLLTSLTSRLTSAESTIHTQATTLAQQATQLAQELAKITADEHTILTQGTAIHTLQTQMTAVMARQSKNVAFTAYFSTGSSAAVNIGTHGIIKFSSVLINTGNGYQSTTGIFTAPVAGTYVFTLNIQSDNVYASHTYIQLIWNGAHHLCMAMVEGPAKDYFDKSSCTAVVHLAVGQQVFARQYSGSTSITENYLTSLSGYLVNAD